MESIINGMKSKQNFRNKFGELNENGISLFFHHQERTIKYEDIVTIRWVKTQRYHFNLIAVFIAVLLLFYVKDTSSHFLIQFLLFFVSLFLLISSFFIKSFLLLTYVLLFLGFYCFDLHSIK
jgi:hypothetical protein